MRDAGKGGRPQEKPSSWNHTEWSAKLKPASPENRIIQKLGDYSYRNNEALLFPGFSASKLGYSNQKKIKNSSKIHDCFFSSFMIFARVFQDSHASRSENGLEYLLGTWITYLWKWKNKRMERRSRLITANKSIEKAKMVSETSKRNW